jgi:nucleolar MIF4G domain-containing protein 1
LEDLHSAASKGKWWLVGAAWGGDPLVERQQELKSDDAKNAEGVNNNALINLAKKQGMNTDIRRSIFIVLMSSDVRGCLSVRLRYALC